MRLLFVEDSERLQRSIPLALRKSGYAVDCAMTGRDALWFAQHNQYDAIILDIMLPEMDGLTALKRLRKEGSNVHVLLLTAKDAVQDRVAGLEAGADDYLVKPFALEELLARVQALCRRSYGVKSPEVRIANLLIDLNKRMATVDAQAVDLQPRDFALLELLALKQEQVVLRGEIESRLYDEAKDIMSNVIDSAICMLRRKLADAGASVAIQTKRGAGYLLTSATE